MNDGWVMKQLMNVFLKSIFALVLAAALVMGSVPIDGLVMVARAANAPIDETEIANWEALLENNNVATVTTQGNVTKVTLKACINTMGTLTIAGNVVLDLNGYGIRYAGNGNASVLAVMTGASLKLKDSGPDRKYIIRTDSTTNRVTEIRYDDSTEGISMEGIQVAGGYLAGGTGTLDGTYTRGGGVYVLGTFRMEDGTIVGNTMQDSIGGGVYVSSSSSFTMTGGGIANNQANQGGGIYVYCHNVGEYGSFKVSGSPVVSGNSKSNAANNVYLGKYTSVSAKITVNGALTEGACIGVSMASPGVFTTSAASVKSCDYKDYFSSDDSAYSVIADSNELKLSNHEHNFEYAASGDIITATCVSPGCELTDSRATLTIVAPTLTTYAQTGEGINSSAILTGLEAFNAATGKIIAVTEIKYVGRDGTTYAETTTAPTDAGKYTAKITVEGRTASVDYEIAKAVPAVSAPTVRNLTYNGSAQELVTAGTASGGTMQYAIGTKDAATQPYTTSIPTGTNVGTYYVWYKVVGDENHNDSDPKCVSVTISAAGSPDNQNPNNQNPDNQNPDTQNPDNQNSGNQDPGKKDPNNQDPGKKDPNNGGNNQGGGNRKDKKTEKITISKRPSSVKAKAKKSKVTVSWKKIKKNKAGKKLLKQIHSIQIQYSTDKTFKKDVRTKTVGKKKTKVTLKLQKKTTYYIRVRYKAADGFSKWSKVKKVKTKK